MKRIIIYCIILIAALAVPVERMDISHLEPIQAVYLYRDGDSIVLETDTEDQGMGKTVQEALADMKYKSSGIVYLDTAEFLLVSDNALDDIGQMQSVLKGSVRVCTWCGKGELTEAAKYMQAHKTGCRLDKWSPAVKLPNLPPQKESK